MANRLLLVVIVCLLGEAASAGPLRRLFGRPRACRPVVIVPARPAERVPLKQPEAVTLRLKFDKAPTYYAEFTSDATQTTSVMGQAVTYQQHQAYYLAWTPRGMMY